VVKARYTVRLLRIAEDDLSEIVSYIAADKPSAAEALLNRIERDLGLLSKNPYLDRLPKEDELVQARYRYLVVLNYLIFYTIEGKTIFVHCILHGARDYLSLL
jgi:plasmid stabilization system protein ParE